MSLAGAVRASVVTHVSACGVTIAEDLEPEAHLAPQEGSSRQSTTEEVQGSAQLPSWLPALDETDFSAALTTNETHRFDVADRAFKMFWEKVTGSPVSARQQNLFSAWAQKGRDFRGEPFSFLPEVLESFVMLMAEMGAPEGWPSRQDASAERHRRVLLGELSRFESKQIRTFVATPEEVRVFYEVSQLRQLALSEIHAFLMSAGWAGPQLRKKTKPMVSTREQRFTVNPNKKPRLWRYFRRLPGGREAVILVEAPTSDQPFPSITKAGYPSIGAPERPLPPVVEFDDLGNLTDQKYPARIELDEIPYVGIPSVSSGTARLPERRESQQQVRRPVHRQ
jgi:hypothetical protein